MNTIGIDMSKETFHAAFDDGTIQEFRNTAEGIGEYLSELIARGYAKETTVMGVEATGIYHLPLAAKAWKEGWNIVVINPLLTAQMISSGLRMVKNDRKDARIVREAVILGKGYRYTDSSEVLALKTLISERADLVEMRGDLLRRTHVHAVRVRASEMELHDSYGPVLSVITGELKRIEKLMGSLEKQTQSLLRTIPGVGLTTAAMLIGYIGDIDRFDSPEKLVAYIGIDPRVKESGTSIHGKGYITKRGNTLLRHKLFQAAFIAKRHFPEFSSYYTKKRKEGKHHTSIICMLERKLIHVIWAVWKRRKPFEHRISG